MSLHLDPVLLFKCLADETRLIMSLLLQAEGELCVCELTCALDASQPKISRHLAQLRHCGLLQDRRQGQWIFYRLHPQLPAWVNRLLQTTQQGNPDLLIASAARLAQMGERPERDAACC